MVIRLQIPESPRYTMDVLLNSKQALRDTEGYFVPEEVAIVQDANDDNPANDTSQTDAYTSGPQQAESEIGPQLSGDPQAEIDSADSSIIQRPKISRGPNRMHYRNGTPHAAPSAQSIANDQQSSEWWSHFKQYITTDKNWIHLAGTMATWFLLDVRSTAFL